MLKAAQSTPETANHLQILKILAPHPLLHAARAGAHLTKILPKAGIIPLKFMMLDNANQAWAIWLAKAGFLAMDAKFVQASGGARSDPR